MASPSSPSVRFTAFDAPTMTRMANTANIQPRSMSVLLKNGTASVVSSSPGRLRMIQNAATAEMATCIISFSLPGRPWLSCSLTFM